MYTYVSYELEFTKKLHHKFEWFLILSTPKQNETAFLSLVPSKKKHHQHLKKTRRQSRPCPAPNRSYLQAKHVSLSLASAHGVMAS